MSALAEPLGRRARSRHEAAGPACWIGCFAAVLALHAGLLLWLMAHPVTAEVPGTPPAAVLIQLAPPAAPPATTPSPAPPPAEAAPPEPPPSVAPAPDVPREPPPRAVTLPKPPPRPRKPPPAVQHPSRPVPLPPAEAPPVARSVEPPRSALPAPAAPPAPVAPQPSPAAIAGARANWQAQLVGWLARYKRYPRVAEEQHQEGVASLAFTMDRSGRVLAAHIARSSGFALLDDEALALIQRAQPLPALPVELPGSTLQLVVPIAFKLQSR